LATAFSIHSGTYNAEQRAALEAAIIGTERHFDMFDFVRCIDIKRKDGSITITIKRLDFEPDARDINDRPDKQEFMASITIHLDPTDKSLKDVRVLSEYVLGVYYYCQIKPTETKRDIRKTTWTVRERKGPMGKTAKLSNRLAPAEDSLMDFQNAVEYVAHSLSKASFRMLLTQNTILLLDQQRRMWGSAI
jgi:hypothetical protein